MALAKTYNTKFLPSNTSKLQHGFATAGTEHSTPQIDYGRINSALKTFFDSYDAELNSGTEIAASTPVPPDGKTDRKGRCSSLVVYHAAVAGNLLTHEQLRKQPYGLEDDKDRHIKTLIQYSGSRPGSDERKSLSLEGVSTLQKLRGIIEIAKLVKFEVPAKAMARYEDLEYAQIERDEAIRAQVVQQKSGGGAHAPTAAT